VNSDDAKMLVKKAWPMIVDESRQQLGGELHYQAVAYHCLRQAGVPARQLGMNVKQWIEQPVTELFKLKSISKKHPAYNGGFEPIPDIVLFKPEVNGNWQRRNTAVTLANMLMVIEMKASERDKKRLSVKEIMDDVAKLIAHREEVEHLGGKVTTVMMVVDVAAEAKGRMREHEIATCAARAAEAGVGWLYVSPDQQCCVLN
jgi:hypothetical protein